MNFGGGGKGKEKGWRNKHPSLEISNLAQNQSLETASLFW